MRIPSSRFETGLRDGTDMLSPYGDINWKRDTLEPIPDVEFDVSKRDDFGTVRNASNIVAATGNWFISFNSDIDMDSSSARASIVDAITSWLLRNVPAAEPVASQTSLRFWLSMSIDKEKSKEIADGIANLFSLAPHIVLEPGFTNAFSEGLEQSIEEYGEPALHEIAKVVLSERTKSSIAMEALQYVGHADSGTFLDARRKMLERCLLQSRSAWVRDGAGLGIASLNDCRSIGALEKAIQNETSEALKEDLNLVMHQLRATSPD